jgi:NDP-sugar pyrophosphorylase family protein
MKALILAAGYGTRLGRDLAACQDDTYAHLVGVAKPLLPIAGYPLITHWIHMLEACTEVSGIYVVVGSHL